VKYTKCIEWVEEIYVRATQKYYIMKCEKSSELREIKNKYMKVKWKNEESVLLLFLTPNLQPV